MDALGLDARFEQRLLEIAQQTVDLVDGIAQPEPDVGGDLVVARAPRVEPLACVPDERREALFDVEVDVLGIQRPFELAGRYLLGHRRHAAFDGCEVGLGQDLPGREHPRVRKRAEDVDRGEALVERHGRREALDEVIHRFGKPAGPRLGGRAAGRWRAARSRPAWF